jgi:hypothetical protein
LTYDTPELSCQIKLLLYHILGKPKAKKKPAALCGTSTRFFLAMIPYTGIDFLFATLKRPCALQGFICEDDKLYVLGA